MVAAMIFDVRSAAAKRIVKSVLLNEARNITKAKKAKLRRNNTMIAVKNRNL